VFRDQYVFQSDVVVVRHVHVVVKRLQQFAVDVVKVFANNDPHGVGSRADHVHNLGVNFIPQQFGRAPQQRHVNFKVNVAYLYGLRFLVAIDCQPLFIFKMGWTVFADARQHLTVFARSAWSIKYQISQVVYAGRKRRCVYCF
jgi:hypothetical protein